MKHALLRGLALGAFALLPLVAQESGSKAAVEADSPRAEMRIFALRHTAAGQLESTLRGFLREHAQAGMQGRAGAPQAGTMVRPTVVAAHQETNSLIVSADPESMHAVEALIRTLDVPGPTAAASKDRTPVAVTPFVRLDDVPKSAAVSVITAVALETLDANLAAGALSRFLADPQTGQTAVRIGAFPDGGVLIIEGAPQRVAEVARLLAESDAAARSRRAVRVVALQHIEGHRAAEIVGSALGWVQPAGPAVASGPGPLRAVAAGPRSIVLSGTPSAIAEALDLLASIDVAPNGG